MDQIFLKKEATPVQSLIMDHPAGIHRTLSTEQNEELATQNAELCESLNCVTIQSPDPGKPRYELRDFDRLVFNIVGFLTDDGEAPALCRSLKEHKNVALNRSKVKLKCGDAEYNCLSLYKGNLHNEISEFSECSEDFYITLLLQVTHGLLHLHQQDAFLGDMDASHIYFSFDRKNAVIKTEPHPANSNGENACIEYNQNSDIFQLGKLFYSVLTKGLYVDDLDEFDVDKLQCSDKKIAGHLILKMLHEEINDCEEILKHPFFWSVSKKITFLCDAFDSCKHDEAGRGSIDDGLQFPGGGWFEKLRLTDKEKTEIKTLERHKPRNKQKRQICNETLYNLASGRSSKKSQKVDFTAYFYDESVKDLKPINSTPAKKCDELLQKVKGSQYNPRDIEEAAKTRGVECEIVGGIVLVKTKEDQYNTNSFFDLLRFFRNRKAHFWESKLDVRRCFQSYPNGFWKFFSSRYPDILCYIYSNQGKFPSLEHHTGSIARNKSLPDIPPAN